VDGREAGIGIEGGRDGNDGDGDDCAGIGCLGPVRIWPGRGVGGAGRAGTDPPVRSGGCKGALGPVANGGRIGAGFERTGSSTTGAAVPLSCEDAGGARSMGAAGALLTAVGGCSRTAGETRGCSSICGGSATATDDDPLSSSLEDAVAPWTRLRMISATGSSMELECVFFSVTPSSGSMSRMLWEGISSCLASSLIRILFISKTQTPSQRGG
jgi:hypothetical protein